MYKLLFILNILLISFTAGCVTVDQTPRPVTVTVMIDEKPSLFEGYTIDGELFVALEDLSLALNDTDSRFELHKLPSPISDDEYVYWIALRSKDFYTGSRVAEPFIDLQIYPINGKTFVCLAEIAPFMEFVTRTLPNGNVFINTNEPVIGESEIQAAVDFLYDRYPHIFTYEMRFEDFGDGYGSWWAMDFNLRCFYNEIPAVQVRYGDAGSTFRILHVLDNGAYRRVNWDEDLQTFVFTEEYDLLYSRVLDELTGQAADMVNNRLWPSVNTLPNGVRADAMLNDEVVELILTAFDEIEDEVIVREIKNSLVEDGLIRAAVSKDSRDSNYWFKVHNNGINWEIEGFIESRWWWEGALD